MPKNRVHSQPSNVHPELDGVHITGPSDVEITMTPQAALETAKRLEDAAIDTLLDQASVTRLEAAP